MLAPTEGEPKFTPAEVKQAMEQLEERVVRDLLLSKASGSMAAAPKTLRPIWCEVGIVAANARLRGLPARRNAGARDHDARHRVSDEQRVDGLQEEYSQEVHARLQLPAVFSVGECKPIRGPGRREIGHGALGRAVAQSRHSDAGQIPVHDPLVSATFSESNGSSQHGVSVCGGTLSLMDAGVPISDPVAGISIGLVKEPRQIHRC